MNLVELAWLFVLLTIVGAGFFNGAEIGMLSVNRARLLLDAERGSARARLMEQLLSDPERFLATYLVGVNLFMISGAAVATWQLEMRYGDQGAALATVVGVLIEVPVMLMLVKICLRSGHWFRGGDESRGRTEREVGKS